MSRLNYSASGIFIDEGMRCAVSRIGFSWLRKRSCSFRKLSLYLDFYFCEVNTSDYRFFFVYISELLERGRVCFDISPFGTLANNLCV